MPEEYLPTTDAALLVWFGNFSTKFAQYAVPLGFAAADATGVNNDYAMVQNLIGNNEAAKAEAKERARYKAFLFNKPIGTVAPAVPQPPILPAPANVVLPGIIPRVRLLAQRIKVSGAYSDAIGRELGIVGASPTPPDPATVKPAIGATAGVGSRVSVKFVKNGFAGVQVQSRRGGAGGVWETLGVSLKSPFVDTRPPMVSGQPEVREYRAVYFSGNAPVGVYSAVATVSTLP